jgi:hypothetical protein
MNTRNRWTAWPTIVAVILVLCGAPELIQAQSAQSNSGQNPQQNTQAQQPGGVVDPSRAPLQPVPPSETLPEAPSTQQNRSNTANTPTGQGQEPNQPLGTAVGQQGTTIGGLASRPAGNAIAPAKQKQYRSLLIKIGALAAAGAAIGTVVALTKGSPSNPPGAR